MNKGHTEAGQKIGNGTFVNRQPLTVITLEFIYQAKE